MFQAARASFFIAAALLAILSGALVSAQVQGLEPRVSRTVILYEQPHSGTGLVLPSSWLDPDGSDWDQWVWDDFTLASPAAIGEVQWRGGHDPSYGGSGGPIIDFTVAFYPSIPAGTEPDIQNPLVVYEAGGNANETLAGVFGGTTMYDYNYVLPAPLQVDAGVKYWVQVEGWLHGIPDWGFATSSSGSGYHFRRVYVNYQIAPGDAAFALLGTQGGPMTPTATATATPANTPTPTATVPPLAEKLYLPVTLYNSAY